VKKAPTDTDSADTTAKKTGTDNSRKDDEEKEKVMNALVTAWCYSVLPLCLITEDFNIVAPKLP
jgi:hypothetical protein